jgi:outer membrane protein assembly factor BamB
MRAIALAALLAAQDGPIPSPEPGWPQWRGPRRDGISAETGLLPRWPAEGPRLLWKIEGLGRGWSSPVFGGGRLYITGDVGEDVILHAFDLEGKPLWRAPNGRAWKGQYPGSRAAPVFSEGRLYHMNAHGRVACLDAATGRELWAVHVLERFEGRNITWGMSECLLVDGPHLIVTPGGRKALLAALDKTDGRTVWSTPPLAQDTATYASPILVRHGARRLLVSCSSEHGFGADADTGRLLWTVPMKTPYDVNASTPVYGDGQIHFGTPYVTIGCYRLLDDGARVERVWDTPFDTCTGSWILRDGLLYGGGYREFKHWIAVDWKTGRRRAEQTELRSGSAVWADGRLYCLGEDGRAALVTPADEGFSIAGSFALTPRRVNDAWAHPVLLDGRLYLRYHDALACYDVRAR